MNFTTIVGRAEGPQIRYGSIMDDVTRPLAAFLTRTHYDDLPAKVRQEAVRTLVNWMGACIGGSREAPVEAAIAALGPISGGAQAGLVARPERFDVMTAALINGIAGHVLDFDDTHPNTLIHPSTAVMPALLALAELKPIDGKTFLAALSLGIETSCRIGNAVSPAHYRRGWHITGTAGVFGAAAAAGMVLALSERQMVWALGLAASQPVGLREALGSMAKGFNAGRAASNGLTAAFLASRNFETSPHMIESDTGWAMATTGARDLRAITDGLGERYEAALNTYKPFACGLVLHAAITAVLRVREMSRVDAGQITHVDANVHPMALEVANKTAPVDGLEGKLSLPHALAVALITGAAGEREFRTAAVQDPQVVALRGRITARADAGLKPDQARVTITLEDGRRVEEFAEHARGSAHVPMSDRELDSKFTALAEDVLPATKAAKVLSLCRGVAELENTAQLIAATRPD
jgi:2-methylcitrate dehydratase PrpD